MLTFEFEHVFRAPSTAALFAAYFDAGHQAEQDHQVAIRTREILSLDDDGEVLRRTCRVVPERQLPVVLRPFASGPLHYLETAVWTRRTDEIAIAIEPSILSGRARITGTYKLERIASDAIRRRYAGMVSVELALLGGRIERGLLAELARSLPVVASSTQDWLDRHAIRSVAARA
jgi:hypothetical protein